MDVTYINAFVCSVKQVFETMVNTDVEVGKPYVKQETTAVADVSGIIGFSGEAAGRVVLSFPIDVACSIASSFAGIDIDQDHPDFTDAVGELANMVAGSAKREFHGCDISISLPSVIIGKEHVVSNSKTFPCIIIPCKTNLGPVYVDVGMKMNKASSVKQVAVAGAQA